MNDLVGLVLDVHVRIGRLFGELEGFTGASAHLASLWAEISHMLLKYVEAFEEVCHLPLLQAVPESSLSMEDIKAQKIDICDAIAETHMHPAGSLPWWLAVHAARAAFDLHINRVEAGILPRFAQRAPESVRLDLGRQWSRFIADRSLAAREGIYLD